MPVNENAASCGREHRQCISVIGPGEFNPDFLPDTNPVDFAVDDIREHRDSFIERNIGDDIRRLGLPRDRIAVDHAIARCLDKRRVIRETMRANSPRIVVHLAAGVAGPDQELPLGSAFPVGLALGIDDKVDLAFSGRCSCVFTPENYGCAAHTRSQKAAGPMRQCNIAIANLNLRMSLTANLADCFKNLCHAAAIARVIVAQSPTIRVEGQLADAGNQVAVRDELPALTFLQKPRSSSVSSTVMVKES